MNVLSFFLKLVFLRFISSAPLATDVHQFPVGTIITWKPQDVHDTSIPCGWELCDGQVIEDEMSPLLGYQIPPLNSENLFLRGSSDKDNLGKIENDTIPQHGHKSLGHTHIDSGHTHDDKGHTHELKVKIPYPVLAPGSQVGDSNGGPFWATSGHYPPFKNDMTPLSKANVQIGQAQISEGYSQLSGVIGARHATETRPKNVKHPFLIKVTEVGCENSYAKVSSLIGWLPDGQALDSNSWAESTELNEMKVFIRGGAKVDAGKFQIDAMHDHSHKDLGHIHNDRGHTHTDVGHTHKLSEVYDVLRPGNILGDENGGPFYGTIVDMDPLVEKGYADIQVSHANIRVGIETIGDVTDAAAGSETRPDNLQVVWIEGNTQLSPEYFPAGSILAWIPILEIDGVVNLPSGWVECNGEGQDVPNINGNRLFLRGGESKTAGMFEESQLQEHKHDDLGHLHTDSGHSHVDAGHTLGQYEILVPGVDYGDQNGKPFFAKEEIIDVMEMQVSKANLDVSNAFIDAAKAVIRDVNYAKTSEEVIPKNLGVKFIIKIF